MALWTCTECALRDILVVDYLMSIDSQSSGQYFSLFSVIFIWT